MKKKVGLYFGTHSIGIAVLSGKDIEYCGNFQMSSLEESKIEAVNEDIRWEALLNKVLREAHVEGQEACVSLTDKDFIVRSLEMPLLRANEVESSLSYEIEKYIPFKVNELEWAYECVRFQKEKRMNVSFVGIRESNLVRIREILSRVGMTAGVMEPSCLSLGRVLKGLKNFSKFKDFAFLDFTESESYLTFFQHGLPVFNRYLVVPHKDQAFDVNKFIESVDFSFQYFLREFKSYKLEKFVILGQMKDPKVAASLQESLQTEIVTLSPYDLAGNADASLESVKALGAATRDFYPSTFKPVFKKPDIQAAEGGVEGELPVEIPMLRVGLLAFLAATGLAVSFFTSVIMGNEVSIKKLELKKQEEAVVVPSELKNMSWKERGEAVKKRNEQVKELEDIVDTTALFSSLFEKLQRKGFLPEGVWLNDLTVSRQNKKYTAVVRGYIFRDDDYKERSGLDELVSALKQEMFIKSVFGNVELSQSRRERMREFEITSFTVSLR